jgi:hypothetical protein
MSPAPSPASTPASASDPRTPDAAQLGNVQWIDHVRRLDGLPGEFRRHGRYLYLLAERADDVWADGHLVDGLQLVRTTPARPTRLELHGVVVEGVERDGSVGIRILTDCA